VLRALQRLNRASVAVLAVGALTLALRIVGLSEPNTLVFDELYYAKAGCILLGGGDRECRIESTEEEYWVDEKWDVGSWVHPPLGKWQIAAGIAAFGMDPFGWRVASAIAGTLVVVGVALIAQLLFARPIWTFVAGLLLAVENLNVTASRLALLDIHLTLWIVAGSLLLLMDRRWIDRRTPDPARAKDDPPPEIPVEDVPRHTPVPTPVWRPWRFAAGAAFGLAVAVKWSGGTALASAVVLSYLWETTRRHRAGRSRRAAFANAVAQESFGLVLAFVLVPIAVYVATWLPWLAHFDWSLRAWWENHQGMWDYHRDLKEIGEDGKPSHPYYSRPWTWPLMLRPVSMYVRDLGPDIRQILAVGNPAVFWASLWAVPYAVWAWWRRRDWRFGAVVVPVLGMWLPWFLVSRPQFFFYALPITPFVVLAIVALARELSDARLVIRDPETRLPLLDPETGAPAVSERHPWRPFVAAYVVGAVAVFVWLAPIVYGLRISDERWRLLVWFRRWI
jgi:dolichyl-phosphate-mannose--protein O-mannosyl transferase